MQDYNEDIVIEQLQNPATVRQAFARVVARYSEPLYWQIRKMVLSHDDANDLLQNTFLKAWGSIEYFRGDAKLSTWLYRIAVNEALTFLARERERRNLTADDIYERFFGWVADVKGIEPWPHQEEALTRSGFATPGETTPRF